MVAETASDIKIQNFYSFISEKTKDFVGRGWLFLQIRDWLSDPNGSRYFLITGKAGTGKSATAARLWEISEGVIINPFLKPGFLKAIHVFVSRGIGSTDPRLFPKSLAKQLIYNVDGFATELIKSSSDDGIKNLNISSEIKNSIAKEITGINIENLNTNNASPLVLFNKFVLEPLKYIIQKNPYEKIVFLIDALDESFTKSDSDLILSLLSHLQGVSSSIRFIITTRDDIRFVNPFVEGKIISISDKFKEYNRQDILIL